MTRDDSIRLARQIISPYVIDVQSGGSLTSLVEDIAKALFNEAAYKMDHRLANEFQLAMHAFGNFMHRAYVIEQPVMTLTFHSHRDLALFTALLRTEITQRWNMSVDTAYGLKELTMHGIKIKIETCARP